MAKKKPKQPNIPKRYTCILKVGDNHDGSAKCVKYRCNDLLKFRAYIDTDWSMWVWLKVYSNRGETKGAQLGYFTKKNPPQLARI